MPFCPDNFRKIVGQSWEENLAKRLRKDADVYEMPGGEPLMQWPFVEAVIDRLEGIPVAVETSGYASDEVFEDVMQKCSLVMLDWKVSVLELHRRYTGVDQSPIRRHAEMLAAGDTPFILRMPIIPGVNDNPGHFETRQSW